MQNLRNVFLVLVTTLFLIACSGSGPESVAKKHMEAMLDNDINALMETLDVADLSSDEADFMKGKLSMVLAQSSAQVNASGGVKKITYATPEYNDDKSRAKVKVTLYFKEEQREGTEYINLIDTDNGWKVSM